jgi:acetylornithine deacetylase
MKAEPTGSLDWIGRLIEIDTTSRTSNLGLIETVRDYLRRLGLETVLTYDRVGAKANLFCSIPDARERITGGIVLSGHTDTVPVDGQDWDTDPFKPTQRDGKLHGRGTADMKGFIGIVLAQVPQLLQRRLSAPVHLAFSFDEEVGCLGAPLMLQDLQRRGIAPTGCIVGEPTSMQVVVSHKGFSAYRCKVVGQAAHSSLPADGVNAIEHAAHLIAYIRAISDEMGARGPFDVAYDVPHSTAQTSSVTGGGVLNTVPEFCQFEFTIRHLPEVEAESIFEQVQRQASSVVLPQMRTGGGDGGVDITFERGVRVPGLEADEQSEFIRLIRRLAGDSETRKVAYGTEAGLFQQIGVPTLVCGPGDIRQAHRRNEYLSLDQIRRCERFMGELAQALTHE